MGFNHDLVFDLQNDQCCLRCLKRTAFVSGMVSLLFHQEFQTLQTLDIQIPPEKVFQVSFWGANTLSVSAFGCLGKTFYDISLSENFIRLFLNEPSGGGSSAKGGTLSTISTYERREVDTFYLEYRRIIPVRIRG